jgi:hypothetical protein
VSVDNFNPTSLVHQWCLYQKELLRFYHRNRHRSVLLNADDISGAPGSVLQSLRSGLQLKLTTPPPRPPAAGDLKPLDNWLIQQLLQAHPAALALEQEMLASMPSYASPSVSAGIIPATASSALSQLHQIYQDRALLRRSTEQGELARTALQTEVGQLQRSVEQKSAALESLWSELHLVQEDLEKHLLQSQAEAEEGSRRSLAHWQHLMELYPDYCEWEHIEELRLGERTGWRVHGLVVMGRVVPPLDISLEAERGVPVLVVHPQPDLAPCPLLDWPDASAEGVPTLRLQLNAPPGSATAQLLRHIGYTDLLTLQNACRVLAQAAQPRSPELTDLRPYLASLGHWLEQLPAMWRFDTIELQHEQRDSGYECLGLLVRNARFGQRHWPVFEFRLAVAMSDDVHFSTLPRLEFRRPSQGELQFENWFAESTDGSGDRYEIRFDIGNDAIDVAAWSALNSIDQTQALSLIAHLPRMLSKLESQGVVVARPWDDWRRLCRGMQEVLLALGLRPNSFAVI